MGLEQIDEQTFRLELSDLPPGRIVIDLLDNDGEHPTRVTYEIDEHDGSFVYEFPHPNPDRSFRFVVYRGSVRPENLLLSDEVA